jgi:6-pyruvoyltetrahydropterin/6-carboxytetrahydropterin synthase
MAGLGAHYELIVNCRGRVAEVPGYLINIKEIDRMVRSETVPQIQQSLNGGWVREPGELLPKILGSLAQPLRGLLLSLRWKLTPYYSVEMAAAAPTTVLVRQKFDFCAAHRLNVASLSEAENQRLFGKCNYPGGHGHNYQFEPCIAVTLDGTGKQRFGVRDLEQLADELIVQRFDHKNLNRDTSEFKDGSGLNPSVENIARVCYELLVGAVSSANPAARLQSVTVWESDRTSCTYPG